MESAVVGFAAANCYIIGCGETHDGAVIDPGTMDRKETSGIVDEVRSLGLKIAYILDTHGHPDHMSGNDLLKSAVGGYVLIHEQDAPKLTDAERNASRLFGMDISVPPADRLLRDGDVVTIGTVNLTVLHTPGHSAGGVAFLGDGFVFTGDTLFAGSIGRSDLPESGGPPAVAFDMLLESIRGRLMTLPDGTIVLSGHGPVTTIGEERAGNAYLR